MVKVSIIVPIYNAAPYLEKCLDSLVNQTLKDIEIILVDNNSTDESYEIAKKYQKENSERVFLYKCKKQGVSAARNYGIKKSKGEYLEFVDSDDYIDLDRSEYMYNYAIEKNLDIVVEKYMSHFPTGKISKRDDFAFSPKGISNDRKYAAFNNSVSDLIVRRSLVVDNNINFHEGICYEDVVSASFVIYTDKIGFMDKYGYHYIRHEGSITKSKHYNKHDEDIFISLNDLYEDYKKHNVLDKYYEEIEYRFTRSLLNASAGRFLPYKEGRKNFSKIHSIMKEKFPKWQKNKYYLQWNHKKKIYAKLYYYKMPFIVYLYKGISSRLLKNILK